MLKRRFLMWSLWPSFLMAGVANALLFTLLDPRDLSFFGHPYRGDPLGAYTIGFFALWVFMAISSGLSLAIQPDFFKRLSQQEDEELAG